MKIIISLHIQSNILQNSHVSTIFRKKNWFLLIFMYIFNASKFLRAQWLYDVTVTSYEVQWYLFWYQWIEKLRFTYTLVANIGVSGVLYRKPREGVVANPLRRTYYKKYLRRTRVKIVSALAIASWFLKWLARSARAPKSCTLLCTP